MGYFLYLRVTNVRTNSRTSHLVPRNYPRTSKLPSYLRTSAPQHPLKIIIILPRGIRNHNPLNIRKSKDQWKGMAEVQTRRTLKCNNKSRWSSTSGFVFFVGRYQCGEMKFSSKYLGSSEKVSIFALKENHHGSYI